MPTRPFRTVFNTEKKETGPLDSVELRDQSAMPLTQGTGTWSVSLPIQGTGVARSWSKSSQGTGMAWSARRAGQGMESGRAARAQEETGQPDLLLLQTIQGTGAAPSTPQGLSSFLQTENTARISLAATAQEATGSSVHLQIQGRQKAPIPQCCIQTHMDPAVKHARQDQGSG